MGAVIPPVRNRRHTRRIGWCDNRYLSTASLAAAAVVATAVRTRSIAVEFGPAEAIDSLLIRPAAFNGITDGIAS
jgi:hypothetical protein